MVSALPLVSVVGIIVVPTSSDDDDDGGGGGGGGYHAYTLADPV